MIHFCSSVCILFLNIQRDLNYEGKKKQLLYLKHLYWIFPESSNHTTDFCVLKIQYLCKVLFYLKEKKGEF